MYIGFDIAAIFIIVLAIAMILLHRPSKAKKYQYAAAWSSCILIGLATLLRDYDVIPSIAGWTIVAFAILPYWTLFYDMFFRKKK